MATKKFSVAAANGQIAAYEGDFEISKEGVLVVTPTNFAGSSQHIYSPSGWWCLDVKGD